MGFTTKGQETKRMTHHWRQDVLDFIDDFSEEQNWDKADVVNRAVMYYAKEYANGNLDDPHVDDSMDRNLKEATSKKGRLRDLLK